MDKSIASLQPLYLKVKRHILDNIGSGKWAHLRPRPVRERHREIIRRIAHDGQSRAAGIA